MNFNHFGHSELRWILGFMNIENCVRYVKTTQNE